MTAPWVKPLVEQWRTAARECREHDLEGEEAHAYDAHAASLDLCADELEQAAATDGDAPDDRLAALYRELGALRSANSALSAELADERRRTVAYADRIHDLEGLVATSLESRRGDTPEADQANRVEQTLRQLDVQEVRLWSRAWYGGLGRRHSVTLTMREARGEVHGDSLGAAIDEARKRGEP